MRKRSGFGWLELIIGILLIVLGILTLAKPDLVLNTLVFAYGIAAVVMGVSDILLYIRVDRYTGFGPILSLISGILSVMSRVMLLVYPRIGTLVLTILFPIWFIAHCISRLTHMRDIRIIAGEGTYYFTLVVNLIGLFLGIIMLFNPLFTLATIRCFASIYLILLGVSSVVVAISRMGTRM